jgi:hypothetical protein
MTIQSVVEIVIVVIVIVFAVRFFMKRGKPKTPSFALWTHRSGVGEMWRSPRTIGAILVLLRHQRSKQTAPSHPVFLKMKSNLQQNQFCCLVRIAHNRVIIAAGS